MLENIFNTFNLIILILFILWLFTYIINKKAKLALPYLIILFITPLYNMLNDLFFIKIFGCGCVPITQNNMLNIPFNSNDLRLVVYFLITILLTLLGYKYSKTFKTRKEKVIYVITININKIDNSLNLNLLLEIAPIFNIEENEATNIIRKMQKTIRGNWKTLAKNYKINSNETEEMKIAFSLCD